MAKKDKKTRPDKYDEKLAIDGTFEDVIKVSVTPIKTDHKMERKDIVDFAISMYSVEKTPVQGEEFKPTVGNGVEHYKVHLSWDNEKWEVVDITKIIREP